MLILTREEKQSIIVNDDIVVTVLRNEKGIVSIGVDAPKDKVIVREELLPEPVQINGVWYGSSEDIPQNKSKGDCNVVSEEKTQERKEGS